MAAADSPAAEPKNAANAGRSHQWTGHAGTTAAAPQPPWGSCGTRAARSPSGTGPARPSPGRPGGHPPAAPAPGSHPRQSSPRAGGHGRCGPPAAGHPHPARRRAWPGSRRPRPPGRRPASAGHPRVPARPGPGAARHGSGRRWLHSACGVPSPPAFTAPALPGLVIREGTPRSHLQTRSTTSGHTSSSASRERRDAGMSVAVRLQQQPGMRRWSSGCNAASVASLWSLTSCVALADGAVR